MTNIAIVVDLETTGLDKEDQIIEIGALKFHLETGEVLDTFQTFSMPEVTEVWLDDDDDIELLDEDDDSEYVFEIPPFITSLTGITNEMIDGAPSNQNAVEMFLDFAKDHEIWAYNAGFDSKFINKHTIERLYLKDILNVAKKAFPELQNHKLSTVARFLNIDTQGAHRAIADCYAAKDVLIKGLSIYNPNTFQGSTFKAANYVAAADGYFFGKNIVFTGELTTMNRDKAAEVSSSIGFNVCTSVSKKTHYLVVGVNDLNLVSEHEKTTKHKKAEEMISLGLDIKIITENEFLQML